MINAKNPLISSSDPLTSLSNQPVNLPIVPSDIKGQINLEKMPDLKSGLVENSDDTSKDPNSFVLLLAEFVSNAPGDETSSKLKSALDDKAVTDALKDDKANDQAVDQLLPQLQADPATQAVNVTDSHAMTWVDSALSGKTGAKEDPLLKTDAKKADTDNLSALDALNSDGKNQESDKKISLAEIKMAISTSREATDNTAVAKFKDDILQNSQIDTGSTKNTLDTNVKIDNLMGHHAQNNAAMQTGQPLATATHPTAAANSLTIPVDINNPQWANKLSDHITWLGHQDVKSALIKINPEELGPMEISVKVDKETSNTVVTIVTHSNQVRDVVDQAASRLKEMMAEQGLNLSEVHVDTRADTNSSQFSQNSNRDEQQMASDAAEEEVQGTTLIENKKPPKGLVDYFA